MRRRDILVFPAAALSARPRTIAPLGEATTFHWEEQWDKPFLHPIRTISGTVLSRGYPVAPLPGEQQDHAWHRGIWYGHGIINGQDFWREQGREKTSRLIPDGKPRAGKNSVEARLAMTAPGGTRLGTNIQRFTVLDRAPLRFIDASISILADQGQALTFGDTDDGGFAFRLNDQFREDRGALLRNAEGKEGTKNIWGKPARWVHYEAAVEGTRAGVAVLDHPSNLRHPTQWHARGYSLCSANPFAAKSFDKNSVTDGKFTLDAGRELQLRYRVVIHDGPLDSAAIDGLFDAWAKT
ncbi:MAG TPA: PmoA family protein [Bryobacteraceae bacterium]|nr:PmoA family protein [Bryobacteraceae bacterium]